MATIAKAYVQVIPSAEGIKGRLGETFGAEGESAGNSFNNRFGGMLKKLAIGGMVVGAAKAMGNLVKSAVNSFADFQQLTGGVETLFGESAGAVMENANNAFRTAGLSANEYMETVTSFSASLLQGVAGDTDKAASISDMAIQDMADNANKMGTSMESIQNAYQGFAKQNYTMLDNLKLGYGGTKTEMERLLADATRLSGVDYNIDNLADVYEAIHVIQNEMGITGTTAEEAAATVSGSMNMLSASWANVLSALGGGGDLEGAIKTLIKSASTFAANLMPVVSTVLSGIITAVPMLMESVAALVPEIANILLENIPLLIDAGVSLLMALVSAIPVIIPALVTALPTIVESLCNTLVANIPLILNAGISLMTGLAKAIPQALPKIATALVGALGNMVKTIVGYAPQMLQAGVDLIQGLINGVDSMIRAVLNKIISMGDSIIKTIKQILGIGSPSKEFAEIGHWLDVGLANGITKSSGLVNGAVDRLAADTMRGFNAATDLSASWNMGAAPAPVEAVRIDVKELSKADIDYIIGETNRRLGAFA